MRAIRRSRRLIIGIALGVSLGVGALVYLSDATGAVTVSRLSPSSDSGLSRFEVRNRGRNAVRLDGAMVYARFGEKFGLVSHLNLGGTNVMGEVFQFELPTPEVGRDWKVKIAYGPEVGSLNLFWWRLKYAWETGSLSKGFSISGGWDAERYAQSEVFHE